MPPYGSLGNRHQDPYGHLHAWPRATTTTVIDLISMTSHLSIHRIIRASIAVVAS